MGSLHSNVNLELKEIGYGNEAYSIKHKATFSLTLLSEYIMKTRDWEECFASVPIGRFEEPSLGILSPATKAPNDL